MLSSCCGHTLSLGKKKEPLPEPLEHYLWEELVQGRYGRWPASIFGREAVQLVKEHVQRDLVCLSNERPWFSVSPPCVGDLVILQAVSQESVELRYSFWLNLEGLHDGLCAFNPAMFLQKI